MYLILLKLWTLMFLSYTVRLFILAPSREIVYFYIVCVVIGCAVGGLICVGIDCYLDVFYPLNVPGSEAQEVEQYMNKVLAPETSLGNRVEEDELEKIRKSNLRKIAGAFLLYYIFCSL